MSDFAGRTVMITGASRGLGAALAVVFGARAASVSLCARTAKSLESIATTLRETGTPYLAEEVDVREEPHVTRWVDATLERFGRIDVLINSASILGPRVPLAEHPVDEWREVIDVNLTGTLIVSRSVLPTMLASGSGSIINVSSGAAQPPRSNWGAYAVSKSGLEALSFNLAAELSGTGVRVNVVDPGAMRTGMRAKAYPEEDPGTLKDPASIAPLFVWLASDATRTVTGQRYQADEWLRRQTG